jgi:hypothetical protein
MRAPPRRAAPGAQLDLPLLTKEHERRPFDTRVMFYLAQTHDLLNENAAALAMYQKRIDAGGWQQEVVEAHMRRVRRRALPVTIGTAATQRPRKGSPAGACQSTMVLPSCYWHGPPCSHLITCCNPLSGRAKRLCGGAQPHTSHTRAVQVEGFGCRVQVEGLGCQRDPAGAVARAGPH